MKYNATVYRVGENGEVIGTFVAKVNTEDGIFKMTRNNAIQCTGLEGSTKYHDYFLSTFGPGESLWIVRDGCAGYRRVLRGLALPPAYIR